MIDRWHAAGFLLQHWLRQETAHSIHSPGLYRLYTEAVFPPAGDTHDTSVEELRSLLKISKEHVPTSPFGPAPAKKTKLRTLGSVVSYESAGIGIACLLQRLAAFLGAANILEIGTSAGMTALYMSANPKTQVVTLEGNPHLVKIAKDNFRRLNRTNISLIEGNADITLPQVLDEGFRPGLVFLDANHRFEPTCKYIQILLPYMSEGGTIVLHDIHHSPEMSEAWLRVSHYNRVSTVINLGTTGILLTDQNFPKQQFYW